MPTKYLGLPSLTQAMARVTTTTMKQIKLDSMNPTPLVARVMTTTVKQVKEDSMKLYPSLRGVAPDEMMSKMFELEPAMIT